MTMKHFWQILGVLALALGFSLTATAADPPEKMRLLVPAYFYPAGKGEKDWAEPHSGNQHHMRLERLFMLSITSWKCY